MLQWMERKLILSVEEGMATKNVSSQLILIAYEKLNEIYKFSNISTPLGRKILGSMSSSISAKNFVLKLNQTR